MLRRWLLRTTRARAFSEHFACQFASLDEEAVGACTRGRARRARQRGRARRPRASAPSARASVRVSERVGCVNSICPQNGPVLTTNTTRVSTGRFACVRSMSPPLVSADPYGASGAGPSPFLIYMGLAARRRAPSNWSARPTCPAISMRIGFTHPTGGVNSPAPSLVARASTPSPARRR
jgi:hypothetical protein